jgi:uncharacterized Zn-finger protein
VNEARRAFLNLIERKPMFDFDVSCPHCEKEFKLNKIGLDAKEFIQCPHCRKIIKLDLADPEKRAIRVTRATS